ncbi:MAG: class II fructose-bisphosphate aldolase [Candidatus Nomurabacteria bacterium]|nr:MAG: class II fructose-bisphosphate aldolase [Candidatus Nomurabacteria bacterium]
MVHKQRNSQAWKVLEKAKRGHYAVGAFNVSTLPALKGILNAAAKLHSPVIIEASGGETKFFGTALLAAVIAQFRREYQIPIILNLDHSKKYELALEGITAGYDLIHFDGSELDPEVNAGILKKVVTKAHAKGLLVEGEREHIGGSSKVHKGQRHVIDPENLTDPKIAHDFVSKTGIDTLAISVGEAHGLYQGAKHIDVQRIRAIRKAVPCFLSLHGGSGIPGPKIRQAVKAGVNKINVNSELRFAFTDALSKELAKKSASIVPYDYLPPAMNAVQRVVEKKIELFGSKGKA